MDIGCPPFEHDEFKQAVKFAEESKFQSERRIQNNKTRKEVVKFSDDKEPCLSSTDIAFKFEPKNVNQSNIISDIPVTEGESTQTKKNIEIEFDKGLEGANNFCNKEDDSALEERNWAELPDLSYLEKMIDSYDLRASREDSENNDNTDESV